MTVSGGSSKPGKHQLSSVQHRMEQFKLSKPVAVVAWMRPFIKVICQAILAEKHCHVPTEVPHKLKDQQWTKECGMRSSAQEMQIHFTSAKM